MLITLVSLAQKVNTRFARTSFLLCRLELFQESHIIFIQQTHVINLVLEKRNPLQPNTECKAGILIRVNAAHTEHIGMHYAAAQNLDPAGAFAEPTALAAAFEAGDIHLCAWLCERKMMRTEFCLCLRPKQLSGKLLQSSLQICKGDILVDDETFYLMEGGECVASTSSERNTRPGAIIRMGSLPFSMVRACTGEVWERSRMESVMKNVSCSSLAG